MHDPPALGWMADPETNDELETSRKLIQRAKEERESLLRTIEQSQKTIDRSREIIAQLENLLAAMDRK
jgi:hypothetical protein